MVTPKRLFNSTAVSTASPGTPLYTTPDRTRCIIKKLSFLNTDATAGVSVSVYIVRIGGGGTLDDAEAIWKTKTLGPLEARPCYEIHDQTLEPGDMLYAVASAGTIAVHGSGIEITI